MAAGQRLVAYERVSTARQGGSGLGLEAQHKTIEDFQPREAPRSSPVSPKSRAGGKQTGRSSPRRCISPRSLEPRWSLSSWTGSHAMRRSFWPCAIVG